MKQRLQIGRPADRGNRGFAVAGGETRSARKAEEKPADAAKKTGSGHGDYGNAIARDKRRAAVNYPDCNP